MTQKIFAGMISVALIVIILCGSFLIGILYDYFNGIVYSEMENHAHLISNGISNDGDAYLARLSDSTNRVTIIDPDGTVSYDSESDFINMDNHSNRAEVLEALDSGKGQSSRYSDTIGMHTLYYAEMMDDGRIIRIATEVNSVWTLVLGVLQPMVFVLILTIIAAALLSSTIARHITHPINEIDLNAPELDEPYEELAPLVQKIRAQNSRISVQMQKLKRQQKEFSIITENMSEGFLIIDNKTEILSHNSAALRILDATEEDAGKSRSVLELNRTESFRKAVEAALKGDHSEQPMEISDKQYHIVANPVFHGGEVTGIVIIILDVTEKERRELLRREFTSNVSHELKTPLTTIYGISDMLCGGIVKPEDVRGFSETIRSESQRMITLIDDIIKLSRLDEGGSGIEKSDTDLLLIAKNVANRLQYAAEKARISVCIEGESSVIFGAPAIIEEMIFNLADNAIKYNKENGSVNITVGNRKVCVSDTGVGIPKNAQERVFERFYRVDKSHSRRIGGTGLGLSIVKHGAAFHNASVELESTEGIGTKITISF